ncbi:MAG: hypothetical protein JO364_20070 [Pseudonocardiales bacterium]|nr:hypothetical protein [Pseudonocardiales bacterium]MBV9032553.1 hypothetical protein [Pseudonocardiales bacterium]
MNDHGQPVLYAIVTGSPAARDIGKLVDPVRHQYKEPDAPDVLPPADAMVVAPITCNSLAKWAAGISGTLPLGLLVEAVGKRRPVVAMPFSNRAQINFPAIREAMTKLITWGVTVLVGDDVYEQHQSATGDDYIHLFPWDLAWQALLHHPWLDPSLSRSPSPKA